MRGGGRQELLQVLEVNRYGWRSQTYSNIKGICNEHPYAHYLDSTINTLLFLLCHKSIHLPVPLSIHPSYFFIYFKMSCRHRYTLPVYISVGTLNIIEFSACLQLSLSFFFYEIKFT